MGGGELLKKVEEYGIIIKNKQDFSVEKFLPELRIHNHTGRNEENYDWRNF